MYHKRVITNLVQNISETFPVLPVTGPRQVGKTTLLEYLKEEKRSYVTIPASVSDIPFINSNF